MRQYKPGARLRSAVCTTEVVVIAVPDTVTPVSCGGAMMMGEGEQLSDGVTLAPLFADGTELGKRYSDDSGQLELLCVKPGEGSLSVDGVALALKGAKPLPSSD